MDYKLLLDVSVLAGEIMAQNGAETYRIEDTMRRILQLSKLKTAEVFVTMTGFFVTLDHPTMDSMTVIRRISKRGINLSKVHEVNIVSRQLCEDELTLEDALKALKAIKRREEKAGAGFIPMIAITAAFTLMFGGTITDVLTAGGIGIVLAAALKLCKKRQMHMFLCNALCSAIIAVLAYGSSALLPGSYNLDTIIIGTIMPLVPGVAITNAVFDTLHGDYLSGMARAVEAFVIAVAIAAGIAAGLGACQWILGRYGGVI